MLHNLMTTATVLSTPGTVKRNKYALRCEVLMGENMQITVFCVKAASHTRQQ